MSEQFYRPKESFSNKKDVEGKTPRIVTMLQWLFMVTAVLMLLALPRLVFTFVTLRDSEKIYTERLAFMQGAATLLLFIAEFKLLQRRGEVRALRLSVSLLRLWTAIMIVTSLARQIHIFSHEARIDSKAWILMILALLFYLVISSAMRFSRGFHRHFLATAPRSRIPQIDRLQELFYRAIFQRFD